jgi:regulator of sigma E protease
MTELLMGNNSPLSAIIAFFVVLIPLILVHELGHFFAAKAVGISILEFAIGFPPRIVKLFTWGETEFTLNWIPLGGYVRPLGEDMVRPLDNETVEKEREELQVRSDTPISGKKLKTVNEVKPLPRIFFMAAGALANFVLAFFLFMLVALIGIPQIDGGSVYIAQVSPDSVFAEAGLRDQDVILDINHEPFVNSADFWSKFYSLKGQPAVLTVQRGEQSNTLSITVTPDSIPAQPTIMNYAQITGVVEGAPADQAGILPGDVVVAFNSSPIMGVDGFREQTIDNAGQEITLSLLRGEETFDVRLIPRVNPPEGQGAIGIVIAPYYQDTSIGVTYQEGFLQEKLVPLSFGEAVQYGANRIFTVINMTVQIPAQVVSGALTPEEARPVSIVGMSQIGGQLIQQSIEQGRISPIIDFIAVISVALGFFNLLPIPALDGGRILFALLEIVRGRPIAPEREGLVHLVGLALLLSLSVLVILNDFINPITNVLP